MEMSIDELRNLSTKIAEDPDLLNEMDFEQTTQMRKYLNPLGNVIADKKCFVNMSLVNWRDRYFRRFYVTSLIGYSYRMLEEYSPDEELDREKRRFDKSVEGIDDKEKLAALTEDHKERNVLITKAAQRLVRNFLNRNFDFNPDFHLRGSHSGNDKDPERKDKSEAIRDNCKIASAAPHIESKLSPKPEETYKYLRSNLLTTYQTVTEITDVLKSVLNVTLDDSLDLADAQGILFKKYKLLADITADMKKIAEPIALADTVSAWKVDPPADVFHQFDRYVTNHYEQLRDVVQALYNEKSDFEYAIVLYNSFKTQEAAKKYRVQHENEFKSDVVTVENSAVTLLGPFKENRERVDFYNKNTEVMKRMMEQVELDHKLGGDIMAKEVKSKKRKNIAEAGPDAPGLASYSKAMNVVSELGAKKVLTKDETDKLSDAKQEARDIKEDYEVPDDAIQVDMFFPQGADGETTLGKKKFYTQAEAPSFMQDPSRMDDQYQPLRTDSQSLNDAYKKKTILGRNGKKKEVNVPVQKK